MTRTRATTGAERRGNTPLALLWARILHGPVHGAGYEDALREANERFERAFYDAPIGMALVGLDGRWLQVNDALCQLTGYAREELLQKTFQDITHPVLLPDVTAEQAALVADKIVESLRERTTVIGGQGVRTTASLGLAAFEPGLGVDAGELLVAADVAMYRAKERGGDRWAQVEVSPSASSTSMRVPNPDAPLPT